MHTRIWTKNELSDWFRRFAQKECISRSKLYFELATSIAEDAELLGVFNKSQPGQPIPNLFLAAVHYLLLQDPTHELASYYPSVSSNPHMSVPFDQFKSFCLARNEEIAHLMKTRLVQTNVVNRCAYLMPLLSSLFHSQEINLIEIGASAGLLLHFDKYAYEYSDGTACGTGSTKIYSEIRSGAIPGSCLMVRVKRRIGLEQNPLSVLDPTDAQWMRALVWPDLKSRFDRLEQAIKQASRYVRDMDLRRASSVQAFIEVCREIPFDEHLVVFHTHVLYQFNREDRMRFRTMLDDLGRLRNLYYIAVESSHIFDGLMSNESGTLVVLTVYEQGLRKQYLIARTDGHANWIEWRSHKQW